MSVFPASEQQNNRSTIIICLLILQVFSLAVKSPASSLATSLMFLSGVRGRAESGLGIGTRAGAGGAWAGKGQARDR